MANRPGIVWRLLAALAIPSAFCAITFALFAPSNAPIDSILVTLAFFGFIAAMILNFAGLAIIGSLASQLLHKLNAERLSFYLILGAILGGFVGILLALISAGGLSEYDWTDFGLWLVLFCATDGLILAASTWFIFMPAVRND